MAFQHPPGRVIPRDAAMLTAMGAPMVQQTSPQPSAKGSTTGDGHTDQVLKAPAQVHGKHPAQHIKGARQPSHGSNVTAPPRGAAAMTGSGNDGVVTRTFAPAK